MLIQTLLKKMRREEKATKLRKQSSIRWLAALSVLLFSGSALAETMCSNDVITKESNQALGSELLDAMSEMIASRAFDPTLPFELISKRKDCVDIDEADRPHLNKAHSPDGQANPVFSPKEGNTQTVNQSQTNGARTWTYTYLNGVWVLTEYRFLPEKNPTTP